MKILGKRETVTCKIDLHHRATHTAHNYSHTVLIKNFRLSNLDNLKSCELECGGSRIDKIQKIFFDFIRKENNIIDENSLPFNLTENNGLLIGVFHQMRLRFEFFDTENSDLCLEKDHVVLSYDVYDVDIKPDKYYSAKFKLFKFSGYDIVRNSKIQIYNDIMDRLVLYSPGIEFSPLYHINYSLRYSPKKSSEIMKGKLILSYVAGENYVYKIIDSTGIVMNPTCYEEFCILLDENENNKLADKAIAIGSYYNNIYRYGHGVGGLVYN